MLELPLGDLWMSYLGLGGDLPLNRIEDFFDHGGSLESADYDRLAQAVNEFFMDAGNDHPVRYSDEMGRSAGSYGG
jgi:hypothetical protein